MELTVNDTELQMLYEAMRRVRPFADMSPELAELSDRLTWRLAVMVEGVVEAKNKPE